MYCNHGINIIPSSTVSFNQAMTVIGKLASGYVPGGEGWTDLDDVFVQAANGKVKIDTPKIGDKLFTRDGRVIGNAQVVGSEFVDSMKKMVFHIKTDFGNSARLTEQELDNKFYIYRMPEEVSNPMTGTFCWESYEQLPISDNEKAYFKDFGSLRVFVYCNEDPTRVPGPFENVDVSINMLSTGDCIMKQFDLTEAQAVVLIKDATTALQR